jgi:GNAT superfamily N-acetyltransferase
MAPPYPIQRNMKIEGERIESLRVAIGWDRMAGYYNRILERSYTHFSVDNMDGRLIAFVNVISDGIADAYLVDLMVHPEYQGQGIGHALVTHAIEALRADGIRAIQVLFEPRLEAFYRACGFYIMESGIIDTWETKVSDE